MEPTRLSFTPPPHQQGSSKGLAGTRGIGGTTEEEDERGDEDPAATFKS